MKTFISVDVKFLKPYKIGEMGLEIGNAKCTICNFLQDFHTILLSSLSAWANARIYLNKEIRRFKESFQNKHSLHVFVKCVSFCAFSIFEVGEAKLRNADSLVMFVAFHAILCILIFKY